MVKLNQVKVGGAWWWTFIVNKLTWIDGVYSMSSIHPDGELPTKDIWFDGKELRAWAEQARKEAEKRWAERSTA
jgi:hypothetical protein